MPKRRSSYNQQAIALLRALGRRQPVPPAANSRRDRTASRGKRRKTRARIVVWVVCTGGALSSIAANSIVRVHAASSWSAAPEQSAPRPEAGCDPLAPKSCPSAGTSCPPAARRAARDQH
jgi:hypothetical protein